MSLHNMNMMSADTDSLGQCLKLWRLQKGQSLETLAFKTRIPLKYLRALEANDFSTLPPIDTWAHTLGDSLRACRERQGISLERISEHTRVPIVYLKALEENNTLQMPAAPVIARSFIESYLSCLSIEESQKEDLMVQYAKLAEAVYGKPQQDQASQPVTVSAQTERSWIPSGNALRDRWYEFIWASYLKAVEWRAAWCLRAISGSRASLAWSRHILHQAGAASVEAGQATCQVMTSYAEQLCAYTRFDKEQQARWQYALTALASGGSQIRHSLVWMQRNMLPSSERHRRRALERDGFALNRTDCRVDHAPVNTGLRMRGGWRWMVRYGFTALFLIVIGGTAADIPLFKETRLIEGKLNVSHLVEFLSYGAALMMVGLISRHIVTLLDRDRSGLAFLRPLVAPMTLLLMVSALNKILLVVMNPFFSNTERLVYNWMFVVLILLSTIWIILTWFFQSAPLLEAFGASGRGAASPLNDVAASDCPRCRTAMPARMKFCGQCGAAISAIQN